jgi:hypothetical protein
VAARVTRCGCKGYKVLLQGLQDIAACITYNRSNLSEKPATLQAKLIWIMFFPRVWYMAGIFPWVRVFCGFLFPYPYPYPQKNPQKTRGFPVPVQYTNKLYYFEIIWSDSYPRCLEHIVNLANVAIMDHVTKLAIDETATAIWEYDPTLPDNRVFGGTLDVISVIRTLAIKARGSNIIY